MIFQYTVQLGIGQLMVPVELLRQFAGNPLQVGEADACVVVIASHERPALHGVGGRIVSAIPQVRLDHPATFHHLLLNGGAVFHQRPHPGDGAGQQFFGQDHLLDVVEKVRERPGPPDGTRLAPGLFERLADQGVKGRPTQTRIEHGVDGLSQLPASFAHLRLARKFL